MNSTPIVLVTGASQGIGLEVVRQLAQRGYTVILTARSLEKGQAALQQLQAEGLKVVFKPLDVTDEASLKQAAQALEAEYGRLDVLVNNAAHGGAWGETPSSADFANVQAVLDTNLFGAWRSVQAFLPLLKKSEHPRVVNVSSGAGSHSDVVFGLGFNQNMAPSYAIAKAALNALTVKLAVELKDSGILVNAVCPGLTATFPGGEAMGARPIPEGAAGVVWAATLPDDGPTGGFFRDGKVLGW